VAHRRPLPPAPPATAPAPRRSPPNGAAPRCSPPRWSGRTSPRRRIGAGGTRGGARRAQEGGGVGRRQHVGRTASSCPRERPEVGHPVRVGQEAHVEQKVDDSRTPCLKPKEVTATRSGRWGRSPEKSSPAPAAGRAPCGPTCRPHVGRPRRSSRGGALHGNRLPRVGGRHRVGRRLSSNRLASTSSSASRNRSVVGTPSRPGTSTCSRRRTTARPGCPPPPPGAAAAVAPQIASCTTWAMSEAEDVDDEEAEILEGLGRPATGPPRTSR